MIRRHIYETFYILYRMAAHVFALVRPRRERWSRRSGGKN